MDSREQFYVETDIGVHYKLMRFNSFMAVSSAILFLAAKDYENSSYWFNQADKSKIVFG